MEQMNKNMILILRNKIKLDEENCLKTENFVSNIYFCLRAMKISVFELIGISKNTKFSIAVSHISDFYIL